MEGRGVRREERKRDTKRKIERGETNNMAIT